ncbi:MAG: tetratricopeptide repeat protein [Zetaproteobacteria bacterium]|nr:tetratricopeptide repeat protein [Zetaproteobacteria bacterium]
MERDFLNNTDRPEKKLFCEDEEEHGSLSPTDLKALAEVLRQRWDAEPISTASAVRLSVLLTDTGNYMQAKEVLGSLQQRHLGITYATNPEIRLQLADKHLELADIYLIVERYDTAAMHFHEALSLVPAHQQAAESYGRCLLMQEKYQECKDLLAPWVAQHPQHFDIYVLLGQAHLGLEDFGEARALFLEAHTEGERLCKDRANLLLKVADHMCALKKTPSHLPTGHLHE